MTFLISFLNKFNIQYNNKMKIYFFQVKECHHTHALGKDGFFMNCLVEHRHEIKDQKCHTFLTKMAAVIFSDYRLISGFYEDCHQDVKKLKCGQLTGDHDEEVSTEYLMCSRMCAIICFVCMCVCVSVHIHACFVTVNGCICVDVHVLCACMHACMCVHVHVLVCYACLHACL